MLVKKSAVEDAQENTSPPVAAHFLQVPESRGQHGSSLPRDNREEEVANVLTLNQQIKNNTERGKQEEGKLWAEAFAGIQCYPKGLLKGCSSFIGVTQSLVI